MTGENRVEEAPRGDFFDELMDWSKRKLELLEKYLDAAVKILGSIDTVYYIDGFAGRGTYRDGAKGSPLVALELASELKNRGKPYALRCINVELDQDHFANLEKETAGFGEINLNLPGSFASNIDRIIDEIKTYPAIFFLDPFGLDGIDWFAVKRLIDRREPTDIWIRFDPRTVRRLDGFFDSGAPESEGKFGNLQKVYGIEDRGYLHRRLAGDTPRTRVDNAVKLYLEKLSEDFREGEGGYASAYPIRSLEKQLKYYLAFASGVPKGAILASDIVYGVEQTYKLELQEYDEAKTQQPLLPVIEPTPDQVFRAKVQTLKDHIWVANAGKTASRMKIHLELLGDWFGRIKGPHVTAALRSMIEEERITEKAGPLSSEDTVFTFRKLD